MIQETSFSQSVICWYQKFGRKTLPWQLEKTPYKVWLSEIMLQQTQVKTVIPYFLRFIHRFPNVFELSEAKLDEILYLWSGLGYYSRAYNLHKTAKIVVNKYHGKFPQDFKLMCSLPGIGRSTAGAVLSLAMNQAYPILDCNVKRILSRYYSISVYLNKKETETKLWKSIEKIIPKDNVAQFNQAMMDIGSMICTSSHPKCDLCPVKNNCQSYINQHWKNNIQRTAHRSLSKKTIWLLILECKRFFLLKKCSRSSLWKGLFCFPQFSDLSSIITWLNQENLSTQYIKIDPFKYYISNFTLQIMPIFQTIDIKSYMIKSDEIWYDSCNPQKIGVATLVKQILIDYQ